MSPTLFEGRRNGTTSTFDELIFSFAVMWEDTKYSRKTAAAKKNAAKGHHTIAMYICISDGSSTRMNSSYTLKGPYCVGLLPAKIEKALDSSVRPLGIRVQRRKPSLTTTIKRFMI